MLERRQPSAEILSDARFSAAPTSASKSSAASIPTEILNSPGAFVVRGAVQTDKTAESMSEILRELTAIGQSRPPNAEELRHAQDSLTLTLVGSNETVDELDESYANVLTFGLPDSYWHELVGEVDALTPAKVQAVVGKLVRPVQLTWAVVGDLAKIKTGFRALGIGEVTVLDADGNKLR